MARHDFGKGTALNFFVSGEVVRSLDFDTHNPFITKFKIPSKTISFKTWKVPKDWTTIKFDKDTFHQHYDQLRDANLIHQKDSHQ